MPLRVVPRRDRKLNREVKAAPRVPVPRGQVLWSRGEPATSLVLVRSGHLRLVARGGAAREARTVQVVGPWEVAGEEALVEAARRRYRAVAGEASAVQWLDGRRVTSVLTTSRVTREAFLAAWLDDIEALGHLASGSGQPDAAGRLASVLLRLAARLGVGGEGAEATVPLRITHGTLADLAGLHRSTVTTQLNDWLYRGWIADGRPGFRIVEAERLRRLAGLAV